MTDDYCELIGLKIHYIKKGSGTPFLILAGWGTTISTYQTLIDDFSDENEVYCLEMPGCGGSNEPKQALSSKDYVELVKEFIKKQDIRRAILFGHSNGGRTIIKMLGGERTLDFFPEKVILTGCAGLVQEKTFSQNAKVTVFKVGKKFLTAGPLKSASKGFEERIKKHVGSDDYRAATPVMRETLVNLVNEDLTAYLPEIKRPTLLLWGAEDDQTPLVDGEIMEGLIPDAGLVAFEHGTHFAFLEYREDFRRIVKQFLKD